MDPFTYKCDILTEPVHRYVKGGYHPLHLGDNLKDGRYKILHKLGWGSYSTVWAARDQRENVYVAIKISVSKREKWDREVEVMHVIATSRLEHPGSQHVVHMMDDFQIDGPNGTHNCLVLEMQGPCIADLRERWPGSRLPGELAKIFMQQALLGLDYLHQQNIGHGDLHTRNLVLTVPSLHSLTESEFLQKLGTPKTGTVSRQDGKPLEPDMPKYLVGTTSHPVDLSLPLKQIKIVDFGESFLDNNIPDKLNTPLVVRAPEVILGERFDHRADLWSMGCMTFELFTSQPPFDPLPTPTSLIREMLEALDDKLPERWEQKWHLMNAESPEEERKEGEEEGSDKSGDCKYTLQEWLEEVYFDDDYREDLAHEDIDKVGELVRKMLKFEPLLRASPEVILQDPWLKNGKPSVVKNHAPIERFASHSVSVNEKSVEKTEHSIPEDAEVVKTEQHKPTEAEGAIEMYSSHGAPMSDGVAEQEFLDIA